MSRPRLSYAEACRLASKSLGHRAEEDREQGYDISADRLDDSASALRALAVLCERAERLHNAVATVPGFVDILSSEERPTFEEWDAIVRALGTGYQPPDEGGVTE